MKHSPAFLKMWSIIRRPLGVITVLVASTMLVFVAAMKIWPRPGVQSEGPGVMFIAQLLLCISVGWTWLRPQR